LRASPPTGGVLAYNVHMDTIVTNLYDRIDELEELRLAADQAEREEIDREVVTIREQIVTLIGNPFVEPPHR
jgi:hypothetical protein